MAHFYWLVMVTITGDAADHQESLCWCNICEETRWQYISALGNDMQINVSPTPLDVQSKGNHYSGAKDGSLTANRLTGKMLLVRPLPSWH